MFQGSKRELLAGLRARDGKIAALLEAVGVRDQRITALERKLAVTRVVAGELFALAMEPEETGMVRRLQRSAVLDVADMLEAKGPGVTVGVAGLREYVERTFPTES